MYNWSELKKNIFLTVPILSFPNGQNNCCLAFCFSASTEHVENTWLWLSFYWLVEKLFFPSLFIYFSFYLIFSIFLYFFLSLLLVCFFIVFYFVSLFLLFIKRKGERPFPFYMSFCHPFFLSSLLSLFLAFLLSFCLSLFLSFFLSYLFQYEMAFALWQQRIGNNVDEMGGWLKSVTTIPNFIFPKHNLPSFFWHSISI